MSNAMILLTPVLVFLIIALLGFVGCGDVLPQDADPEPDPSKPPPEKKPFEPGGPVGPPKGPYLPPPAATYEELVTKTAGFAALWPLDEISGLTAAVVGGLSPGANGVYKDVSGGMPVAGSYSLGKQGVLFPKDSKDLGAEFTGTGTFIEVPFQGQLNPGPGVGGFSVELWVKPDPGIGADRGVVVSSHNFETVAKQQGYEIGFLKVAGQAHHQIYARVYSGTGATQSEVSVQPLAGDPTEWRYVVFTFEYILGTGPVIRLYVQLLNATDVYEKTNSDPTVAYENVTSAKPATLRFAGSHPPISGGGVALFAGRLDNIAFYNVPLSAGDIQSHYGFV